jgi:hypothetical protein
LSLKGYPGCLFEITALGLLLFVVEAQFIGPSTENMRFPSLCVGFTALIVRSQIRMPLAIENAHIFHLMETRSLGGRLERAREPLCLGEGAP